ncbi:ABC transporter substrate-binding protein [Halobacteria archaeon HArc-gm2]|nr:ABC transporter substrate-binding protein [Halobacteria archaeon HArc-gm2]
MTPPVDRPSTTATRRAVLAGVAGSMAATSGCVSRLRTVMGRERPDPVTVTIKTVPADDDPYALLIARQLSEWLRAAGINANVLPMASEELLRQVLVNHEYDLFVGRYPDSTLDADSLYSLLHSQFATEPGWQNPFGYANLSVDDLLARQRTTDGDERRQAVADLQSTVARENPFTVLAFPDVIRAARDDRYSRFGTTRSDEALGMLQLHRADDGADALRVTTTDERVTSTLNPLLASVGRVGTVTDLIYDPLVRRYRGERYPWLAESTTWVEDGVLEATLRPDLSFHDGEALTADDVVFSYRFLRDTASGERNRAAPTMRFRGRSTLAESVTAPDRRTVRLTFGEETDSVAERALTVPILPRHVWTERTGEPRVGGLDLGGGTTEALVTANVPPVGSGPLAFVSATRNDRLVLKRFADHFLETADTPALPDAVADGAAFEELVMKHVGSDSSAVDLVDSGDADLTLAGLGPGVLRRIGQADELDLLVDRSQSFYFLGFNTRRAPYANPRFRQLIAQLVDRRHLVQSVFSTFAAPAISPLARTDWVTDDLTWRGRDPITPFIGAAGEVDDAQARAAFREAGYQYDEQGRLLGV